MTEPAPVVLVIDDEIQIRRFLRAGLELDGFVVHEAETGAEAMRAVTLTPPTSSYLIWAFPIWTAPTCSSGCAPGRTCR